MTEQELKDAIASACKTDYERVMAAPKHRFSRAFRKKIKELLQPGMGKRTIPKLYPVHGRRRVIVVVAVLVLLLGTTVMAKGFFQSVLGKHVLTGYNDHVQLNLPESEDVDELLTENATAEGAETETDVEFVCKKPQWVPDGYELENEEYNENIDEYIVGYINQKEKYLWYQQMRNDTSTNIGVSSKGRDLQKINIGNCRGYFVSDSGVEEDDGSLIWDDGKYVYMVSGTFSQEELVKIAKSIK